MLSGPSAQTWLAWIQGKSAMRSALKQECVPLSPTVSTQPLYHSVVVSPAYSILYPRFTLFSVDMSSFSLLHAVSKSSGMGNKWSILSKQVIYASEFSVEI